MQVSFILPLYNQLTLTRACLESLRATVPSSVAPEIILVDDGSTDGTREFLRELAPPCVVLLNERNLGYAAANNRAARIAHGELLVLLNNDLVLTPGWLEPLLAAVAQVPRPGIIGNIQLNAATGAVDHAGMVFRDGGYPVHHRGELRELQAAGEFVEFPAVTAACCLLRRDWFLRAGGFDEGYVNGFEDTDLGLRAREDGLRNFVATRSVVRHHISSSPGRGAHEFRNAGRFLARWGPRTAQLEREWNLRLARREAARAARVYFTPWHRKLGLGRRALRRAHGAALAAERQAHRQATRSIRIGVDLLRLQPGGANGGVKPFVLTFLGEIGKQEGDRVSFAVFAPSAVRSDLEPVLRPGDFVLEPEEERLALFRRQPGGWKAAGSLVLNDQAALRAGVDVLYAPFAVSRFLQPGLPSVSLIVDLLHRDLPAALPIEEVNFRESGLARTVHVATFVQCNSHHVAGRLALHYGVHPARCFHTYNAVQDRLPPPEAEPPPGTPAGPFFFYPANFWPHKNHETLFVAYRLYALAAGSRAWPLVCTGHPDARMTLLRELATGLGIGDRVNFLGHIPDAAFSALWPRAGAMIFPSLCEGFGMPLLEAMRFGVPIIAADSSALPEVAGDSAVLVDPRDPHALADTLRRVAIRTDLKETLVANGRERLRAFSLEREAGRLAHFLAAAGRGLTP